MRIILLDYLENSEEVMTAGALATRSQRSAADITPSLEDIRKMLKWTKKMRLSSVLDFSYYIITIEGVSRSFTHQWVRYRIAAHMQQSLRFVKIDPRRTDWFVVPPTITRKGVNAVLEYVSNQFRAGETYLKLLEMGIPPEDARFALPIGVKTHLASAFDAEEYIHILYQRMCFDAQWEIRTVANALLLAGLIVHPNIFEGVGPPCIYEGICRGTRKNKCKKDVEELIGKLTEIANKARKNLDSLKPGEFLKLDLTDVLGYKAPDDIEKEVSEKIGVPINLDINVILEVKKK
ncbi:MAG: FAD-dependent thymidylate synthase [Candidatus Njordarchaeales archaeon]